MKILFVCLALSNGGAERVVSVLSEELMKHGNRVYILPLLRQEPIYQTDSSIQVLKPEKDGKGFAGKIYRILNIRKCIKQYGIDTIIAFSHYNAMYSVVASTGLNVKVIGSERNDPAQAGKRKLLNWLRIKLYNHLDCLVCQTEDAKAYFPEKIREKTVVILNPIMSSLPEPYKEERKKRVVSFLRLEPQKNIPMLIDAFENFYRKHSDYTLDIYGDGSLRDDLQKYVGGKGLESVITISPFQKNIHSVVLDASMFVLSSDYEGLSNSMLEAMAIGLPTICTDCPCGGARMVIEDGVNGLLVPVGDADALAEAMSRVVENKNFAEQLSQNGQKIREKLNVEKIANEWEKAIIGR